MSFTVETIYSPGKSNRPGETKRMEDGFIVNPPFFGVVDGMSEPHSPQYPPLLFNGLTSGQIVRKVVLESFCGAENDACVWKTIRKTNQIIARIFQNRGLSLKNAGELGGASFVFLKIEKGENVEIIQGGDALCAFQYGSGSIGVTKNRAFVHVSRNLETIAELMRKYNFNRNEMWEEFRLKLAERRQKDINNPSSPDGFAILNGQTQIESLWQSYKTPINGLKSILLFTDGFVPYDETKEEALLAQRLLDDYSKIGLKGILLEKRKQDEKEAEINYVKEDEATAVAINFH